MESDNAQRISELRADGGAVANPYLMQFQADLLDRPVVLPKIAETTAMGAAMLAGLAAGVWKSAASLDQLRQGGKTYRSKMRGDVRDQLLAGWRDAVSRVLTRH
jgi:glycerol kinase